MGLMLAYSGTLVTITCFKCGVMFGVDQEFHKDLVKTRQTFSCPNGHEQHFMGESEADKLRKELERERTRRQLAENTSLAESHARERAEKKAAKAEKKLKRVGNGVCPCCNRSFTDLRRHMATKHPEHK
jgi:hypothetical protein